MPLQAKVGNPARVKCVLGDDRLWRFQSHTLRPIFVGRDHPFSLTIDPDPVPHDRDEPLAPSRAQPDPQVARINLWCRLSLFAARDRPRPGL